MNKIKRPRKNSCPTGKRDVALPPAPASVECPGCKGTRFVKLAASETVQRLQCASSDCGEHFGCPISMAKGLAYVGGETPDTPPLSQGGDAKTCPKCGRRFLRAGSFLSKHVAKCDGAALTTASTDADDAPARPKPSRPQLTSSEGGRGPSLKIRVISFIRDEREHHNREADLARKLIDAIADVELKTEEGGE